MATRRDPYPAALRRVGSGICPTHEKEVTLKLAVETLEQLNSNMCDKQKKLQDRGARTINPKISQSRSTSVYIFWHSVKRIIYSGRNLETTSEL
jgi:hypothetical protein